MDDRALDPRELIARTPALAGRTPIACTPLAGGLSNRNYLCTVGDERVVVRIVEAGGSVRGDRGRELAALERAAAAGIAPEVVAAFPEGHLITRFFDARSWSESEFARPEVIARVAPLLRRVHALPAIEGAFSPYRDIEAALAALSPERTALLPERDRSLAPLAAVEARRAEALGGEPVLCHNDPYFPNVLYLPGAVDDGGLKLIDWEFAGMGDPIYDLAAATYPWAEGQKRAMLAHYHGDPDPEGAAALDEMIYVCAFWNAVWALGKMGASAIDYDYGALFDELVAAMERHRPS